MVEKYEVSIGENLSGIVEFVVLYTPYNFYRDLNAESSKHDVFTSKDIKKMARCLSGILKPGTHGHIFCSTLQFVVRYKVLCNKKRDVAKLKIDAMETDGGEKDKEEEQAKVVKVPVFEVESAALCYIYVPGNYSQPTRILHVVYTSIVETAIQFWKKAEA